MLLYIVLILTHGRKDHGHDGLDHDAHSRDDHNRNGHSRNDPMVAMTTVETTMSVVVNLTLLGKLA